MHIFWTHVLHFIDEGLSCASFMLLSESDLQALGFRMGARKLLIKWIESSQKPSAVQQSQASSQVQQPSSLPAPADQAEIVATTSQSSVPECAISTVQVCLKIKWIYTSAVYFALSLHHWFLDTSIVTRLHIDLVPYSWLYTSCCTITFGVNKW